MSYQLQDAFDQFDFRDSVIQEISFGLDSLHVYLENVKILPENTQNRDIITKRTNDMDLLFVQGTIQRIVEEGYQLYDADMNPYKKVEDREIPVLEYEQVLESMKECYVDEITQNENLYSITVTVEDHTWRIDIQASSTKETWNKFIHV